MIKRQMPTKYSSVYIIYLIAIFFEYLENDGVTLTSLMGSLVDNMMITSS